MTDHTPAPPWDFDGMSEVGYMLRKDGRGFLLITRPPWLKPAIHHKSVAHIVDCVNFVARLEAYLDRWGTAEFHVNHQYPQDGGRFHCERFDADRLTDLLKEDDDG